MVVSEMVQVVGHELGHNWGSFHDPSDVNECRSFIMNEYAQDGNLQTHFVSPLRPHEHTHHQLPFVCVCVSGFLSV